MTEQGPYLYLMIQRWKSQLITPWLHNFFWYFQVFDFTLTEKDMDDLKSINKGERLFPFTHVGES